jgi:hypothetical protein
MNMADQNQLFVDGVFNVAIQDGAVRVDFFQLSPTQRDAEGKPQRQFAHRLIMSPQGFLQTYSAMDQLVKQLEERGLVQRKDGAASTTEETLPDTDD